ncbi:MAG: hypothetical protein ACK5JT_17200 [Hyphomicrobiaceae bacterium]
MLNGFIVTVADFAQAGGGVSLTFGLSPFQLVTVFAATMLLFRSGPELPRNRFFEPLAVALALVPSSAVAWAGLLIYSLSLMRGVRGERCAGLLLIAGLALASLWSAVGMNALSVPITSFETAIVAKVLSIVEPSVEQTGNVIGLAGGFKLVVLPACTSATILPNAMLALTALVALFQGKFDATFLKVAGLVAVLLTIGNDIRLAAMSLSGEHYALIHGPVGANLFDLFQTALIVGAAYGLIDEGGMAEHA